MSQGRVIFRYKSKGTVYAFSVEAPYAEGHRLTLGEAQALNQLRAENIQDIMRSVFAETAAKSTEMILLDDAVAQVQAAIDAYDTKYQFVERHEPRERLDSLEREALRLARGRAAEDATEEQIKALASDPELLAEAREHLEAQARVANSALEDLIS